MSKQILFAASECGKQDLKKRPYRLYQADCFEILRLLPAKSIQITLTDIPYGEVNQVRGSKQEFHFKGCVRRSTLHKGKADEITFALSSFCKELCRLTTGSIYIFCGIGQVSLLNNWFRSKGMTTRLLIWEKTNPFPLHSESMWLSNIECCVYTRFPKAIFNGHYLSSVLQFPISSSGRIHPTQKPVNLMQHLIAMSSKGGDTVLDPCMGSGSSGVAAIKCGCSFIGIEKEEIWFAGAEKRIEAAARHRALLDIMEAV